LKSAIEKQWGSVDAFKKEFNAKTAAIQGSGWGWLVSWSLTIIRITILLWVAILSTFPFTQGYDKGSKKLEIVTTSNQDPLLSREYPCSAALFERMNYISY
jgi:Fe-Mn family superoxide dismutase